MDEFRKPFDYFEEKGIGGILLILFFMLIAVEPLMGIAAVFFGYHYINDNILRVIFMCLAAMYILFAIFSGILLKRKSRFAVRFTKIFLIFRLAFMAPYLYVNMRSQIYDIQYEITYSLYEKMYGSIVTSFIICLSYVVVFSAVWYAYLCKSKKVGDLFMSKDTGAKSGA
jgi:hypothetical protein